MPTIRSLSIALQEETQTVLEAVSQEVVSILEAHGFQVEASTLQDYHEAVEEALRLPEITEADRKRLEELLSKLAGMYGQAKGAVQGARETVRAGVAAAKDSTIGAAQRAIQKKKDEIKQAYQRGQEKGREAFAPKPKPVAPAVPSAAPAASTAPTAAPLAKPAVATPAQPQIRKRDGQPVGTPSAPGQGKRAKRRPLPGAPPTTNSSAAVPAGGMTH